MYFEILHFQSILNFWGSNFLLNKSITTTIIIAIELSL